MQQSSTRRQLIGALAFIATAGAAAPAAALAAPRPPFRFGPPALSSANIWGVVPQSIFTH